MNDSINKNKGSSYGVTIFMFLMAVFLLFFVVKQQFDIQNQKEEVVKEISKKVSEEVSKKVAEEVEKKVEDVINRETEKSKYPDYESLNNLKQLRIIENFESWTPDANKREDMIKKEIIVDHGKLSKGYVYIKISINNKAFTKWESIYLMLDWKGGHLFRSESLPIPSMDKTELLYSLDDVPYIKSVPYSENKKPFYANWFNLFGDKKRVQLYTFISSLKPAMIEEMIIYYDCVDKEDCLLSLQE